MSNIFTTLILERNPEYVDELITKYSIQLPPVFKAFVQTFEFGEFKLSPNHKINHPNPEFGSISFDLKLEEVLKVYLDQGDYYQAHTALPIITSGIYASGICLGIGENNLDRIFLYTDNRNEKLKLISPNILHFISELKEINRNDLWPLMVQTFSHR